MAESFAWYATSPDDLIWASWQDDYIAYHRPSGKTHFLNAESHWLLTDLLREPMDVEAIAAEFLPAAGPGKMATPERKRKQLLALLNHLEQIGLVRRA